jgi:hypothetical protein
MLRVARTDIIASRRASGERSARGASPEPGEGYRCYRIDQKLALLSPLTRLARARHPLPTSRGEGVEHGSLAWDGLEGATPPILQRYLAGELAYRRGPLRSNGPFSVR